MHTGVVIEGDVFVNEHINRINMYGSQPDCIKNSHTHLRKFSYRFRNKASFNELAFSILESFNRPSQLGSLSKPRRRRQRERRKTKGLMSRTIAVHVRYKSLYISLPSSAKRQREMTKFCVVYGTWTTAANFSNFHLELKAVVAYLARARF